MACLFSLLYNIPLQGGIKEPLAGGGCCPHLLRSHPVFGMWQPHQRAAFTSQPKNRSRCTESGDVWLGHFFLFQSMFWRNGTDSKENSELGSIIFLLEPAKCQSLFCLTLTAFVNCSEWYLLIRGECSNLPLLMNQMVSSLAADQKDSAFSLLPYQSRKFLAAVWCRHTPSHTKLSLRGWLQRG